MSDKKIDELLDLKDPFGAGLDPRRTAGGEPRVDSHAAAPGRTWGW